MIDLQDAGLQGPAIATGSPKASESIEVKRITRDLPTRFGFKDAEEIRRRRKRGVENRRVAAVISME
jgi:hypothetical protein